MAVRLGETAEEGLVELAELWALASPSEPIGPQELRTVLVDGGGTILVSEDGLGAVAFVQGADDARGRGNIRLLAVHPDSQRRGHGLALLRAAENRLRGQGVREVRLAGGVPRYLWPGVDVRNRAMRSLATAAGYASFGTAVNMTIATSFRADPPAHVEIHRVDSADAENTAAAREFVAANWPIWLTEFDIAAGRGTVFAAWAEGRAIGFFAHSTMRAGWIGPMGTDPEFRSRGVGAATLADVCRDLEQRGHSTAEIAWVGPVGYFADRGAQVSRTFSRFVKRLD